MINEDKECHFLVFVSFSKIIKDITFQSLLSSDNWLSSIRLAFLFSSLVQFYSKQLQEASAETLLNKIIIAVGYYASFSEQTRVNFFLNRVIVQLFCTLGWQRSLLYFLCTLPFDYFSNSMLKVRKDNFDDIHFQEILLPTLIAIVWNNPIAVDIIKHELSCSWMVSFIKVSNDSV